MKGAFTGAGRDRPGRFQMANGGTLLLDEIGELPVELQAKLLRVLQEGRFEPVGSDRTVKVDVRDPRRHPRGSREAIARAALPRGPLLPSERVPAAPAPAARAARGPARAWPRPCSTSRRGARAAADARVTPEGLKHLAAYDWPGNIRELANVLERATILSSRRELGPAVLDSARRNGSAPPRDGPRLRRRTAPRDARRRPARAHRAHARRDRRPHLRERGAAERLGLKPSTLQSRMKKLAVRRAAGAGRAGSD